MGKPRSTYMHCGSTSQHLYTAANKRRSTFYIPREYRTSPTCTYSSTSQHLYAAANKFRSTFYILRHSLSAYASRCEHLAQRWWVGRVKRRVYSCETQVSLPGGRSSPCGRRLGVNGYLGIRGSSTHSEYTQSPQQPKQSAPTLLAGMSASTSALRCLE